MNCHDCKFKQTQGHTHHISCTVLDQEPALKIQCFIAGQTFAKVGAYVALKPHGVKNGWASWPLDFDPIWVEDCKFFQEK